MPARGRAWRQQAVIASRQALRVAIAGGTAAARDAGPYTASMPKPHSVSMP
jgi:hypothetical protein